jgi:hypothetical protein
MKKKVFRYLRKYNASTDRVHFNKGGVYAKPTLKWFEAIKENGVLNGWTGPFKSFRSMTYADFKERHANTLQKVAAGVYDGATIDQAELEYNTPPELSNIKFRKQKMLPGFIQWIN